MWGGRVSESLGSGSARERRRGRPRGGRAVRQRQSLETYSRTTDSRYEVTVCRVGRSPCPDGYADDKTNAAAVSGKSSRPQTGPRLMRPAMWLCGPRGRSMVFMVEEATAMWLCVTFHWGSSAQRGPPRTRHPAPRHVSHRAATKQLASSRTWSARSNPSPPFQDFVTDTSQTLRTTYREGDSERRVAEPASLRCR